MTTTVALLVTRDADRWLPATLRSIARQDRRPDGLVAVDDGSTDGTVARLRDAGFEVLAARCAATDTVTRIAANFVQGVRACAGADIVVLGDHDDIWHEDRVGYQEAILAKAPTALMVASDGRLVDADQRPSGGTLRSAFPIPADWPGLTAAQRMRVGLRTSVATGGASAIRPALFPALDVPAGWLHDRWWSLVALARAGLIVDDRAVIDYRIQPGQQVGVDRAAQGSAGPVGRLAALLGDVGRSWGKARDLRTGLRPVAADEQIAAAISLRSVLARR